MGEDTKGGDKTGGETAGVGMGKVCGAEVATSTVLHAPTVCRVTASHSSRRARSSNQAAVEQQSSSSERSSSAWARARLCCVYAIRFSRALIACAAECNALCVRASAKLNQL